MSSDAAYESAVAYVHSLPRDHPLHDGFHQLLEFSKPWPSIFLTREEWAEKDRTRSPIKVYEDEDEVELEVAAEAEAPAVETSATEPQQDGQLQCDATTRDADDDDDDDAGDADDDDSPARSSPRSSSGDTPPSAPTTTSATTAMTTPNSSFDATVAFVHSLSRDHPLHDTLHQLLELCKPRMSVFEGADEHSDQTRLWYAAPARWAADERPWRRQRWLRPSQSTQFDRTGCGTSIAATEC